MDCPDGTVWNQRLRGCAFTFDPEHPCEIRPVSKKVAVDFPPDRGFVEDYNSVVYKNEEAEEYKGDKYYVESGGQKKYDLEDTYIEEQMESGTTEIPY